MLPYKLENKEALNVSSYYDYLYCYLSWFAGYKISQIPPAQRDQFSGISEFLNLADKMLHGVFREVLYARLLKTYLYQQPWDPADRNKTYLQMIDDLLAKIKNSKENALSAVYKHDLYARNNLCRKYNEANPAVYNDDNAPVLSLPDESGRMVSVRDIHGKYILMHFWTSDTGTNARENKEAQIIQQDMENDNLVVLNICIGTDSAKWKIMLAEHNFGGVQLYDKDSTSMRNYGGPKIPYYILIGRSGKILEYFYSQSLEAIKPFIVAYLKEQ
jgi:peroxiredoxin